MRDTVNTKDIIKVKPPKRTVGLECIFLGSGSSITLNLRPIFLTNGKTFTVIKAENKPEIIKI